MNRRAGYAEPIIDIFITILIIMVIIVFYMMFKWSVGAREYHVNQNAAIMDGSEMLYAILRSPVPPLDPSKQADTETIGEYLQRDALFAQSTIINPNLNDKVYLTLKPVVEEYSALTGCEIKISISQGQSSTKEPIIFGKSKDTCAKRSFQASQVIPRPDGDATITLSVGVEDYLRNAP